MSRASLKKQRGKNSKRHFIHGHLIHVRYMEAVPKRADLVVRHLRTVKQIFETLFADENFVTLLRAESMTMVPVYLQPLLTGEKTWA